MPRVVRTIETQEIVFRRNPEFDPGDGIQFASNMYNLNPEDLEEVVLTEEEISAYYQAKEDATYKLDSLDPRVKAAILTILDYIENPEQVRLDGATEESFNAAMLEKSRKM